MGKPDSHKHNKKEEPSKKDIEALELEIAALEEEDDDILVDDNGEFDDEEFEEELDDDFL